MSDDHQEHIAELSEAFHAGYGIGIGDVQDDIAERVAAAEQRGYDRAVTKLRDEATPIATDAIAGQPWHGLQLNPRHADHLAKAAVAAIVTHLTTKETDHA
jgi:hypothetical protein